MFLVKLCTTDVIGNLSEPPRNKAHETEQLLSHAEEKELVRWITRLTITGYPPQYDTLREMAEEIRNRVCVDGSIIPPLSCFEQRTFHDSGFL